MVSCRLKNKLCSKSASSLISSNLGNFHTSAYSSHCGVVVNKKRSSVPYADKQAHKPTQPTSPLFTSIMPQSPIPGYFLMRSFTAYQHINFSSQYPVMVWSS